jgi:hypothetical protein
MVKGSYAMSTAELTPEWTKPIRQRMLPLENGDRLTRAEFEHRYGAMPKLKKAELIEGVVHMPSPVSDDHAGPHGDLIKWLGYYEMATPGIAVRNNGTVRLDADNEVQPDVFMRILEQCGGQSHLDEDGYVAGAPEFVSEVAMSSANIDLHSKLQVYRRNGVREYVVWRVVDGEIDWFILREGRFDRLRANDAGIHQSEIFPGLWVDAAALIRGDLKKVSDAVRQGLSTPEHAAFVQRLQGAAAKSKS